MKRGGRPPKLTPEVQERICQALRAGNYRNVAARFAGVSVSALKEWYRDGKSLSAKGRKGPHLDFYRAVNKAEADAEILVVGQLMKAAQHDSRAMAFWLERKHPGRWGRTDRLKVTGKGDGPVELEVTNTTETARKLKEALLRKVANDGTE